MSERAINFPAVIAKFDEILARGLSAGLGDPESQMCIEAAICAALGLPHGDEPDCVTRSVRDYKIALNTATWSSPMTRASGLRKLGIAQIGSNGIVDGKAFSRLLRQKTISVLIPDLFRRVFPDDQECLLAARECELKQTTREVTRAVAAAKVVWVKRATKTAGTKGTVESQKAAAWAARVAEPKVIANIGDAAWAAKAAEAAQVAEPDYFLLLSAQLALDTLTELNSPGVAWL